MARIVVTVPFSGAPEGEHYPRRFNKGEELAGDLARVALAENWAVDADADTKVPVPRALRSLPKAKQPESDHA